MACVPYTLFMRRERLSMSVSALGVLLMAGSLTAQNGDRPGEVQRDVPEEWQVEAPGPLSPEEALAAFTLAPGYRIELVAAEPLVHDPVQIAFGADGTLWVLEMRGYMPNADGEGELETVGRVAQLRDTDGDGRMDESVVFLDNLILPRAIAPAGDGLLVVEPPNLVFCRDTDGDGRADDLRVLVSGFGGLESPEHAGNGLRYGIDNWYETSQHNKAFRLEGDELHTRRAGAHGQWGVTRDDLGRLYYSPNSDPLIIDAFPKHYAARNPESGGIVGIPTRLAHDRKTFPVRKNPGVNRGYQDRTLRADGTLANIHRSVRPGDLSRRIARRRRLRRCVCVRGGRQPREAVCDEGRRLRPACDAGIQQQRVPGFNRRAFSPSEFADRPGWRSLRR